MFVIVGILYILYKISSSLELNIVTSAIKFFLTAGIVAVLFIIFITILPIILIVILIVYLIVKSKGINKDIKENQEREDKVRIINNGQRHNNGKESKKRELKEKIVEAEFVEEENEKKRK